MKHADLKPGPLTTADLPKCAHETPCASPLVCLVAQGWSVDEARDAVSRLPPEEGRDLLTKAILAVDKDFGNLVSQDARDCAAGILLSLTGVTDSEDAIGRVAEVLLRYRNMVLFSAVGSLNALVQALPGVSAGDCVVGVRDLMTPEPKRTSTEGMHS